MIDIGGAAAGVSAAAAPRRLPIGAALHGTYTW
jgi:hypothetical protein